jgi:hypothetical protein
MVITLFYPPLADFVVMEDEVIGNRSDKIKDCKFVSCHKRLFFWASKQCNATRNDNKQQKEFKKNNHSVILVGGGFGTSCPVIFDLPMVTPRPII